jgi:hypothetical protein
MTVLVNNIDIDIIKYQNNKVKLAIINNEPVEENLNVIMVVSNICQYARRYILAREFINRMSIEPHVILYIVELAYLDQEYYLTNVTNSRHLQLRTSVAFWHKENMINIAVEQLLPKNWKVFCAIDADVEFESPSWALDTLKILNGHADIVQLFSHALDMNLNEDIMSVFSGFGFQYTKKRRYGLKGPNFWHPGFTIGMTRKAYNKIKGIYEYGILGAGDHNTMMSMIGKGMTSVDSQVHSEYKQSILEYQKRLQGLRLGYVPGVIRHYYHGSKRKRYYHERWKILVKHNYSPQLHITKNSDGILVPTKECPEELLSDILEYFKSRDEDEGLKEQLLLQVVPDVNLKGREIFYINTNESIQRNTKFLENIKKFDLKPYRIQGIIPSDFLNLKLTIKYPKSQVTDEEYACTISHIKAIFTAYTLGKQVALIAEDDLIIYDIPVLTNLPRDYEIIQLLCIGKSGIQCYLDNIRQEKYVPDHFFSTAAYLINRRGMERILNLFVPDYGTITELKSIDFTEATVKCAADHLIYSSCKTYTYSKPYFNIESVDSLINGERIHNHKRSAEMIKRIYELNTIEFPN